MLSTEDLILKQAASEVKSAIWRAARLKTVQVIAAFILILAVMVKIEFGGPAILDNDGYYHIRWSKMLRESAPHLPKFKWLPLTTLNQESYVDHHFLFHVLLIPFTFGDLRIGAKAAACVFSALAIASLFWLMVVYEVPYRWLWLVPLVGSSEPFLYRMSMTRAPSLSLLLLAVGVFLILKRKWIWLAASAFVFVWLYSLFPLLFAFAGAYSLAAYLTDRRIDLWGPLSCAAGIGAGLVINPYFPRNLLLFKEHVFDKAGASYAVDVGVEWYPYDTWVIVGGSAIAFVLFVAALLAFDFRERKTDIKPLFLFIVSAMLLVIAFKSRRFIEYWPPFAVLQAAFTFAPIIANKGQIRFPSIWDRGIAAIAAAALTVTFAVVVGFNIHQARKDVSTEPSPYTYKGASEWLVANTPEGSMVFNTDWDTFPALFYYNSHNTYIVGLDPTYLYDRDPDAWKVYADVTLGNKDHPGSIIRDRFRANYVVTGSEHSDFMEVAEKSGDFEKVYVDQYATVLRVRGPDEPRPPGQDSDDDDDDDSGQATQ